MNHFVYLFFFFQAEDGIRDDLVTGVQTCALPISLSAVTLYMYQLVEKCDVISGAKYYL